MIESKNKERNLRKKLRNLENRENREKTSERDIKIEEVKQKLNEIDTMKQRKEKRKTCIVVKEKSRDEMLEEAYQENHMFWKKEKEKQEERKQQDKLEREERKKRNEYNKENPDEEISSNTNKKENIKKISNEITKEYKYYIPKNIRDYLNKKFDKIEYFKLLKEYHPDKNKHEPKLCELFTQLINEYKTD